MFKEIWEELSIGYKIFLIASFILYISLYCNSIYYMFTETIKWARITFSILSLFLTLFNGFLIGMYIYLKIDED